jgi:hypothetical protein
VTQPTATSQCTTPPSTYTMPTILFAQKAVIQSGAMFSGVSFTIARQTTFFQMVGAAFDATKAQVYVHIDGPVRTLSLAAAHGTAQAVVSGTVGFDWVAGSAGVSVFFPNVDVGSGTTMLTADGSAIGTGAIPLVAGTITNVTIKTN